MRKSWLLVMSTNFRRFRDVIKICMKLPWFWQLFCNCPLFVIALVPGLFFGGKPVETSCHPVVSSKWLKTQSVYSTWRNTTTKHKQIIKNLAVQSLKNNELEEQCTHHFNLVKYLVLMSMSILRKGLKVIDLHVFLGQFGINSTR